MIILLLNDYAIEKTWSIEWFMIQYYLSTRFVLQFKIWWIIEAINNMHIHSNIEYQHNVRYPQQDHHVQGLLRSENDDHFFRRPILVSRPIFGNQAAKIRSKIRQILQLAILPSIKL